MTMIRSFFICCIFLLLSAPSQAQETPQFSYSNFQGWVYSGGELTSAQVSRGIYLYTTSLGNTLTLISPSFLCAGIDTIAVAVTWTSLSPTIALTAALDDVEGTPIDSVSALPESSLSYQRLTFNIPVSSHGLTEARLRFVSWGANISNGGAIRKVETSAITANHETTPPGDVDGSGQIDIADVTALIDYLLGGNVSSSFSTQGADVDRDGHVTISDVTALIDLLLSGK